MRIILEITRGLQIRMDGLFLESREMTLVVGDTEIKLDMNNIQELKTLCEDVLAGRRPRVLFEV